MPLPAPAPGLVVQYGFLWGHEAGRGHDNARYPRPCAVVLARRPTGRPEVTEVVVAPFTHLEPDPERAAVALPERVRRSLGLQSPTWVMVDEVNIFDWPGHDLERNDQGDFAWGWLPPALHAQIAARLTKVAVAGILRLTRR